MSYMLSYQSIACNTLNTYVTDKKLSSLKLRKFLVIVEDYAMVVSIFFFFFCTILLLLQEWERKR